MAQIPSNAGIPDVQPSTNVPTPYQRLSPAPAPTRQYSEAIPRGLQQFGTDLQRAGQKWGEIAADDVSNQFQDQANKILHGDPNTPNPDGTPDTGYLGLKGESALRQRQTYEKKLDDLLNKSRSALVTPDQTMRFDNYSRRYRAVVSGQMGTHADTQANAYAQDVAKGQIKAGLDDVSNNANDENLVAAGAADTIDGYTKLAERNGAVRGDTLWKQAQSDGAKAVARARILSIGATDPVKALQMTEDPNYKKVLGTDYHVLAEHLRTRADNEIGSAAGKGAFSDAVSAPFQPLPDGTKIDKDMIHKAVVGGESGGQQTDATGKTLTSPDNAQGIGQITPDTWKRFAKPGEDINKRADNLAVSKRITDYFMDKYNGDWARTAVAYFSGEGNVAPAGSPTPWVVDKRDQQGKGTSVSDYVADKAKRLGAKSPQQVFIEKNSAIDASNLTEPQKEVAKRRLREDYHTAEVGAVADTKAKKDANDEAANQYTTQILSPNVPPDILPRIANDPKLDWHTKHALTEAAEKHLGDDVERSSQHFGPGFWETRKKVLLPAGDPNRIAEPSQILSRAGPGGDLTLAGAKELIGTMGLTQKSVNDHMVAQTQQSLMQYAKKKMSFEEDSQVPGYAGLKDPAGEKIFHAQFVPKFLAAYDQWVKDGKDPWKFLTQENVDSLAEGMRSTADMARDRLKALGEGVPGGPRQPIPPVPAGINENSWKSVIGAPPLNSSGQEYPLDVWTKIVQTLRDQPTPERIAAFNKNFGPAGYDANEILGRLQEKEGTRQNLGAANQALKLTPQEKFLYEHHLSNLEKGGVANNGQTSSLLAMTIGVDGKTYVIPSVWDNKILMPDAAIKRAEAAGLDKFPSYKNEREAKARYDKMHDYMEKDTTAVEKKRGEEAERVKSSLMVP